MLCSLLCFRRGRLQCQIKNCRGWGRHLLLLQPRHKGLQEPAAGGAAKALGSVLVVSQSQETGIGTKGWL